MAQINLGSGDQGSPPTEAQKQQIRDALDISTFTTTERDKLEGIETGADVTDTTNVVAALTPGSNITIAADGTISSTDTTLSDEQVQDIIGAMVTGNTESGITVTYDDATGSIVFSVEAQTDENFTTADHSKLDAIEAGADVTPAWVPDADPSYATETYVDSEVSNLVDSAPGTLDTLNELADALGDDPNFATTITSSIGTKLPLAGGTMSGDINMGENDLTNVGNIGMAGSTIDVAGGSGTLTIDGDITVTGDVDGRDLSDDGTKLDGIEAGATADQSDAEIKTAYENNPDTNAFTDADHTKLDGIETAADVTDTDNVVASLTAGSNITIAADGTISAADNSLSDEQVQDVVGDMVTTNSESGISVTYDDTSGKLDFSVASQTDENFTTADHLKLDGIESGATGDQTAAEIRTLVDSATDSNVFTDADNTKLGGIEASADVTDTDNVVASLTAGTNVTIGGDGTISSTDTNTQLSDEEVQDVVGGMVESNTESGISVTYDDTSGTLDFSVASQTDENFTTADHTKLDGIESGATADQTASEIRTLVDSATDSNVFTDADHTKLDGIEASADVTPAWVPDSDPSYATETYVDTEVSNLVDSAPGTLDTLNELASALGDDPNFATTVSTSIGTKLPLAGGTMTGDIVMSGSETVDGRDLSVDGAKLDGIESGATADQSDAEIKTAYENNADTNAFTDADHTKLDGIESSADVTDTANVVASLTAGTNITIGGDGTISSTDTNDNTQLTDEEVQDIVGGMVTGNTESGITVTYDDTDGTLDFSVASQTDENFTTADHTKLDGIESGADVTDTANVTAAGALMDSEVTNLDQVKAFDSSDYAPALGADDNYVTDAEKVVIGNTSGTNTGDQDLSSYQLQPSEGAFVDGDKTKLDGIEAAADVTDTANVVSALTAGTNITIAGDGTISATDTNTQLSDEEVQDVVGGMVTTNSESGISVTYDDTTGKLDFSVTSQTDENFTTADHAKLDGIEAGATADQSDGEIKTAYENNADTNAFTDADHSKLDGISSGADVTPAWVPDSDPTYATETYVDTEVSNLVDSAPGTLDTLNELAAALGDDPNFATTVSTSIGTKLPLAGF